MDLFKSNAFSCSSYESIKKEKRLVVCILLFQLFNLAMRITVFVAGCLLNLLASDFPAKTNVASAMQPPGVVVRTTFGDDDEVAARRDYDSERETCGKAPLNKFSSVYGYEDSADDDAAESDGNNSTSLPIGAYIVGGGDQKYGEWPSFATITALGGWYKSSCGGTLIGRRHVLTAAHCMFDTASGQRFQPRQVQVKLGKHNLVRKDIYEQVYRVSKICISRVFKRNDAVLKEDFAVLTLEKSAAPLNNYVQVACLPSKTEKIDTKRNCWAVGAGASRVQVKGFNVEYRLPDRVQKLQVEEVGCRDWHSLGVKDRGRMHICFSKKRHQRHGDTCLGDSGGPILCNSEGGRWTVAGIVSFGTSTCDGPVFTGVYTNVAGLASEIRRQCGL